MQPFKTVTSKIAPLDAAHVDTDQIIPKQFLKRVERSGFGQFLFFDWRFIEEGKENPEFSLNKPEHKDAEVLIARENFGCGSSREHAPWALLDYGFKVIIAPSFADIFYNNCFQNGILPIVLPASEVDRIFQLVDAKPEALFTIDLQNQKIIADSFEVSFHINDEQKNKLINGLDDIGYTLQYDAQISEYEKQREPFFEIK